MNEIVELARKHFNVTLRLGAIQPIDRPHGFDCINRQKY